MTVLLQLALGFEGFVFFGLAREKMKQFGGWRSFFDGIDGLMPLVAALLAILLTAFYLFASRE